MPLVKGYRPSSAGRNIRTEVGAGKPRSQAIAIALSNARRAKVKMAGGGLVEDPELNDVHGSHFPEDELDHLAGLHGGESESSGVSHYDPAAPQDDRDYDLAEEGEDMTGPLESLEEEPHGHLFMATDFHSFEDEPTKSPNLLGDLLRKKRMMSRGGSY